MSSFLEPTTLTTVKLLPATAEDRYFDYCLEPYRPRRPWEGKLRCENLLWHSVVVAGAGALRPVLAAVQEQVGRDLTVWGVKWDGSKLWWELYFYDPQKEAPEATFAELARALGAFFPRVPPVRETIPYMMVSFDLTLEALSRGELRAVNLYLTGERHHAGRSYEVTRHGVELQNTYRFLPPKAGIEEVLPLLQSSVFVDYGRDPRLLAQVMPPELFACKKVCIAKKRHADAIYFSGITVEQLRWFLTRHAYPPASIGFLERHQERFEHLFFDVGVDYRMAPSGKLEVLKTSYYGTL